MTNLRNLLLVLVVLALMPLAVQAQETARLQVIHNAADPAAEMVDIYLGETLLLNDFAFRAATPFIDAPANQEIVIGVAPSTSSSVSEVIASFTFNLTAGEKYIAVANGVLDPNSFAGNPDGISTGFDIYVKAMAQEMSMTPGNVEFAVMHGSTDAPTVDIVARGVATLVDNAPYTAITDYISVPPADYTIDVKDSSGAVTVATFTAPLSGLADGAAFVFASGFFDSTMNQDGPAFGVYAALADGQVLQLPAITTARLQVIHNAADPAAEMVDIYLNGERLLDDFGFRTATPFIDAPANQDIKIGVAPGTSSSSADIIATFDVNLLAGEKYVVIANGVLNPDNFVENPDGISTAFTLFVKPMAREEGTGSNVDFFIVHGSTDAPAVDVVVRKGPVLAENVPYGGISEYVSVSQQEYIIYLSNPADGTPIIAFDVNLVGLGGQSAVVLASGFFNEEGNQGGKKFELIGVLANGDVVIFPDPPLTNVEEEMVFGVPKSYGLEQNYPNPFNPTTNISFSLPNSEFVRLSVYNMLGQEVATLLNKEMNAGQYRILFDASNLVSGVYYYRIEAGDFKASKRMLFLQ